MGLGLTLLPLRGPQELTETSVLCYDRLSFDRDYEIFGQLNDFDGGHKPTIKATTIPPQMWIEVYGDGGIERRREDGNEEMLTFVYAQQLKGLRITSNTSPRNKAIKAFIQALPDDTPIILLWY